MKITKIIAESSEFVATYDGPKYCVDKFPERVGHYPYGSLIFLKEDPRFSWLAAVPSAPPVGRLFSRELSLDEEIVRDGYFCYKSDTSLMIDLATISEMVMVINARAGLPDDFDGALPQPTIVKEIPVDDLDQTSLLRLSEGLEEMRLARSPNIMYVSIAGSTVKAMLDDSARGYFLGFKFRRQETTGMIVRSVFEGFSDVDFVVDSCPPSDAERVLSYF